MLLHRTKKVTCKFIYDHGVKISSTPASNTGCQVLYSPACHTLIGLLSRCVVQRLNGGKNTWAHYILLVIRSKMSTIRWVERTYEAPGVHRSLRFCSLQQFMWWRKLSSMWSPFRFECAYTYRSEKYIIIFATHNHQRHIIILTHAKYEKAYTKKPESKYIDASQYQSVHILRMHTLIRSYTHSTTVRSMRKTNGCKFVFCMNVKRPKTLYNVSTSQKAILPKTNIQRERHTGKTWKGKNGSADMDVYRERKRGWEYKATCNIYKYFVTVQLFGIANGKH